MPRLRYTVTAAALLALTALLVAAPAAAYASSSLRNMLLSLALQTALYVIEGDRASAAKASLNLCIAAVTAPPGLLSDDKGLAELVSFFGAITYNGLNTTRARLLYLYLTGVYSPAEPLTAICGVKPSQAGANQTTTQPLISQAQPEGVTTPSENTGTATVTSTPATETIQENTENVIGAARSASPTYTENPTILSLQQLYKQFEKLIGSIVGAEKESVKTPYARPYTGTIITSETNPLTELIRAIREKFGETSSPETSIPASQVYKQIYQAITSSSTGTVENVDFNTIHEALSKLLQSQGAGRGTTVTEQQASIEALWRILENLVRENKVPSNTGGVNQNQVNTGEITGFEKLLESIIGVRREASSVERSINAGRSGALNPVRAGRETGIEISRILGALTGLNAPSRPSITLPQLPSISGSLSFLVPGGVNTPSIGISSISMPSLPQVQLPSAGGGPLPMILILGLVLVIAALLFVPRIVGEVRIGRETAEALKKLEALEKRGEARAEDVASMFARILDVLGVKCGRPKYHYETHREYEHVIEGDARPVYHEAAMAYELVKFGHRDPREFIGRLKRALERIKRVTCRG